MVLFNSLIENDLIFFGILAGTVGLLSYSWYNAANNILDGITDRNTDNLSGINSNTGTQIIPDSVDTISTVLPIPPVDITVVPNPEIIANLSSRLERLEALTQTMSHHVDTGSLYYANFVADQTANAIIQNWLTLIGN